MNTVASPAQSTLSGRRYAAGWLMFCALTSGTLLSSLHRLSTSSGDFNQFIEDGRLASSTRQLGRALPLAYPPTARPLFMLMAAPPPAMALIVWWFIHAWMYWQCAVWLAQWFRIDGEALGLLPVFCLLAVAAVGIASDLSVGQLTGLVLFCIVGAFEMDRRGHARVGGVLLAIPLLVKPLPVVLLPYYMLRRRWAFLQAVAGAYLVFGPLLLTVLFGWTNQIEGWRWFFESTAGLRSPWTVFHRWAELSGRCLTFRESGLASSLVRLFEDVPYDKFGHSVQIAALGPDVLRGIWLFLVAAPMTWAAWLALRCRTDAGRLHIYAAFTGIMLLANPKFISYWLALPMVTAAPLAARLWIARKRGRVDRLSLSAVLLWLAASASVGIPLLRAAGSFPLGIGALTIANLFYAPRAWPEPDIRIGAETRLKARRTSP